MDLRKLGRSGLRVSLLGLGCNNFGGRIDLEGSRKVVHRALDSGITLFDTADRYGGPGGSETVLGKILASCRSDIVLATKFGMKMDDEGRLKGGSRRHIMNSVEGSLRRLKTDWIDLYQMHEPDPLTPIEETMRALEDIIRQGKVRYIGASNFAAWQVVEAQWTARSAGAYPFTSVQDEYSLAYRGHERELIPAIKAHGLGFIPYRPLASGLLTGKYRRDEPPPEGTRLARMKHHAEKYTTDANFDVAEKLRAFATTHGRTMTQLALSWLLAQPVVSSVIFGASTAEQVDENVAAIGWNLSDDDIAEIDRVTSH